MKKQENESKLVKSQFKTILIEGIEDQSYSDRKMKLEIKVRYDDQCGNGHNSFSITGTLGYGAMKRDCDIEVSGCIHDIIRKHAPKEISNLIKWHLVNSDEPMYYVANTMYHASDTDCDGLRKGEYKRSTKQVLVNITNGGEPTKVYETKSLYPNKKNNPHLAKSNTKELDKLKAFTDTLAVEYIIKDNYASNAISEGKEPNLEAARSCAVWPEATIEQLRDKGALLERLPSLMAEFKKDIEALGFTY